MKLIDEQVPDRAGPTSADLIVFEQAHRSDQQIVEVERVGGTERLIVALPDPPSETIGKLRIGLLCRVETGGVGHRIFRSTDRTGDRGRGAPLHPIQARLAQEPTDETLAIVLVIDGKASATTDETERIASVAAQPHRHLGVEGADP